MDMEFGFLMNLQLVDGKNFEWKSNELWNPLITS